MQSKVKRKMTMTKTERAALRKELEQAERDVLARDFYDILGTLTPTEKKKLLHNMLWDLLFHASSPAAIFRAIKRM